MTENIILKIGNSLLFIAMSSRNSISILHQVWGSKSTKINILRNFLKIKNEFEIQDCFLRPQNISVQLLNVLSLPLIKNLIKNNDD